VWTQDADVGSGLRCGFSGHARDAGGRWTADAEPDKQFAAEAAPRLAQQRLVRRLLL